MNQSQNIVYFCYFLTFAFHTDLTKVMSPTYPTPIRIQQHSNPITSGALFGRCQSNVIKTQPHNPDEANYLRQFKLMILFNCCIFSLEYVKKHFDLKLL